MEPKVQRRPRGLARRMAALGAIVLLAAALASQAQAAKYVVLYKQENVASDAATTIKRAGGSVVASYPQIGVVIAESGSTSFASSLSSDGRIEGAASTAGLGVEVDNEEASGPPESGLPNSPVNDSAEPLFPFQWNMRQIHTPEAHAITGGSREVLVGDIDTGIDYTHPDLAPNVDFANSADCSSGAPNQDPAAWLDRQGHGTMTAGIIAAAANGIGIVGVAPNVRIAAIKASSDSIPGALFPEMVICGFMWAATHGVDVTNNSYFADPWYFNCRNDEQQRAIWIAERRAIRFAMQQGVAVVAAAANQRDDLAHPTRDIVSPDFPPGSAEERRVRNACAVIPVEIPGVIGVSADGVRGIKAFYSNYGSGVIQVTAPSSDVRLQLLPDFPFGRVVSTFPGGYGFGGGTSAATPHVTGVAALVQSRFGPMSPGQVAAVINQTADPIACPDAATLALYAPFPQLSNGEPQSCQGGASYNSWYGHGQVNAFRAVTHRP